MIEPKDAIAGLVYETVLNNGIEITVFACYDRDNQFGFMALHPTEPVWLKPEHLNGKYLRVKKFDSAFRQRYEELSSMIADLRSVFPFDKSRDVDNGYPPCAPGAYSMGEIIAGPNHCLAVMNEHCRLTGKVARDSPGSRYFEHIAEPFKPKTGNRKRLHSRTRKKGKGLFGVFLTEVIKMQKGEQ